MSSVKTSRSNIDKDFEVNLKYSNTDSNTKQQTNIVKKTTSSSLKIPFLSISEPYKYPKEKPFQKLDTSKFLVAKNFINYTSKNLNESTKQNLTISTNSVKNKISFDGKSSYTNKSNKKSSLY